MDKKNIFGDNPKLSFFLGLFVGIAAFSTISALIMMLAFFSGSTFEFVKGDDTPEAVAEVPADGAAAQPTAELAEVPEVTSDDNVRGPSDAKVTLISYSDFECPYCTKFSETIEQIADEYGDDIRVVFRHFPLSFHANAKPAAMAAECAGEQGKFWEMHDIIFDFSFDGNMDVEIWKDYAENYGLDMDDYNDCMDNEKYADKIIEQMKDGAAAGVRGTPATFVNGKMVSGALPFESFVQLIDGELE